MKLKPTSVSLEPEERERLEQLRRLLDVSYSDVLRLALALLYEQKREQIEKVSSLLDARRDAEKALVDADARIRQAREAQ